MLFVYTLSIVNKFYRKNPKMCDNISYKTLSVSNSFFTLIFEPGRQHLSGTIFPGVIMSILTSPGSPLSHLVIFDQINTDVLFKRENYLYMDTFRCLIVFYTLFHMNDSEWGLKCSLISIKVNYMLEY